MMSTSSLRRWLESAPLSHPLERRQAYLMQIILLGIIAVFLIAALITAVVSVAEGRPLDGLIENFIAACLLMIPLWVMRRGRFRLAMHIVIVLLMGLVGLSTLQGLQAHTLLMFALPLTLASLLLGRPTFLLTLIASIGFITIGLFLQATPDQYQEVSSIVLNAVLLLGVLGLFLDRFGIVLRESLDQSMQQEQALLALNETLEARVRERTAELTTANEELVILSGLKDEFVANVSHELRTPVTSIKLNHKLLEMKPANQKQYFAVLNRETDRLAFLIEDLLTLSRLDRGQIDLQLIPFDLNQLVRQYTRDRMALAESHGIRLEELTQPDLPPVVADPHLIEQALSVIVTNALNYTPPGGQVTIQTVTDATGARNWIGAKVKDTGCGIPLEEQPHLFDRFYRGTAARELKVAGTGLGLSIAHKIVDLYQGRIDVQSDGVPGNGTTFTLWLPTAR